MLRHAQYISRIGCTDGPHQRPLNGYYVQSNANQETKHVANVPISKVAQLIAESKK